MYPDWFVFVGLATAVLIWLGILSFLIWKQGNFLKSLFPQSGERDIRKKFAEVLSSIEEFKGDLGKAKKDLVDLEGTGSRIFQELAYFVITHMVIPEEI